MNTIVKNSLLKRGVNIEDLEMNICDVFCDKPVPHGRYLIEVQVTQKFIESTVKSICMDG